MTDLNALMIFAKVVEGNSFSEAARRLGMPISTVSRRVAELEDALGVRLLERSTRKLRLTDVGLDVYTQAQKSLEVSDAVQGIVSNNLAEISGTLRLSAPPSITDSLISPLVTAFQSNYPDVRVNILVTERMVDHIAEGVDLVFRVGPLQDSSLVARCLLRYRHQLVASPRYLAEAGVPEKPIDLLKHRLLSFSYWSPQNSWTFTNGKKLENLPFQPHFAMNDYIGLANALAEGAGIGDLPPIVSPSLIKEGRLVEVMPAWRFRTVDLSVVHLGNRHIPRSVRMFKEFAIHMAHKLFEHLPD